MNDNIKCFYLSSKKITITHSNLFYFNAFPSNALSKRFRMFQKLSPAFRLVLLYFLVSTAWILLSDKLVIKLIGHDIDLLNSVQSVKGMVFVVSCSFLLFFV